MVIFIFFLKSVLPQQVAPIIAATKKCGFSPNDKMRKNLIGSADMLEPTFPF